MSSSLPASPIGRCYFRLTISFHVTSSTFHSLPSISCAIFIETQTFANKIQTKKRFSKPWETHRPLLKNNSCKQHRLMNLDSRKLVLRRHCPIHPTLDVTVSHHRHNNFSVPCLELQFVINRLPMDINTIKILSENRIYNC